MATTRPSSNRGGIDGFWGFGGFEFPHERQHGAAERLDFLLEMQKAAKIKSTPSLR